VHWEGSNLKFLKAQQNKKSAQIKNELHFHVKTVFDKINLDFVIIQK